MSLPSLDDPAPTVSGSPEIPASAWVLTDDLDGPLCALSLYLSVAERQLQAPEIDRDGLGQALHGRQRAGRRLGADHRSRLRRTPLGAILRARCFGLIVVNFALGWRGTNPMALVKPTG